LLRRRLLMPTSVCDCSCWLCHKYSYVSDLRSVDDCKNRQKLAIDPPTPRGMQLVYFWKYLVSSFRKCRSCIPRRSRFDNRGCHFYIFITYSGIKLNKYFLHFLYKNKWTCNTCHMHANFILFLYLKFMLLYDQYIGHIAQGDSTWWWWWWYWSYGSNIFT